ncbi:MAG: DUF2284 domain-containing protein [Firmicutes bacterium]|nr:DUF2284 domain-containing protein [Bacillota bacterium]
MEKCRIERFQKEIGVSDYLEGYVAVEEFLEYCKACPNYGVIWSCPPFDFDAEGFWCRFSRLLVIARKIHLPGGISQEEGLRILSDVKADMTRELLELEAANPGSVSLSAGSCSICRKSFGSETESENETVTGTAAPHGCTRPDGQPCRYPDTMRYSIEALGGNVGLTVQKLLGIQLEWMEEGKLPSYFVLVGGLLMP